MIYGMLTLLVSNPVHLASTIASADCGTTPLRGRATQWTNSATSTLLPSPQIGGRRRRRIGRLSGIAPSQMASPSRIITIREMRERRTRSTTGQAPLHRSRSTHVREGRTSTERWCWRMRRRKAGFAVDASLCDGGLNIPSRFFRLLIFQFSTTFLQSFFSRHLIWWASNFS